ncbi:MAG: hypothetical protein ACYS8Z_08765 [Planctomycetota bacterium]|jgi:hypothetical protein
MKTMNNKNSVKIVCLSLILLALASPARAYPPDNAAALYYKAFLLMHDPNDQVRQMMYDLRKGKIKPNDQIKAYLDANKHVIRFVETAAEIPDCDWGHDFSQGLDLLMPELSKLRFTAFMLTAKARILAEEGDYKAALGKCLTMHKMARHAGDSLLLSCLVSIALNDMANQRIQDLLSSMPQDPEMLLWLKKQIAAVSTDVPSVKAAMAGEKEMSMREILKEDIAAGILEYMDEDFAKSETVAEGLERARKGDAKFFEDNREYCARVWDEAIAALDLPYRQAHKKLEELDARIQEDAKKNQAAIMAALLHPTVARVLSLATRGQTMFNATKAAIEIYIVKARTGKFPEKLPPALPKDMFSGEDFQYEKTKNGFILRCRGKELDGKDSDKNETYKYEFRVAK